MRKTGAAADAFQKTKAADATGGEPMNSFVTSLLAVAALAELAGALSPPKARDPIRRIAFLAALLVLIAPIRALYENREDLLSRTADLLDTDLAFDPASADCRLTAGVIFRCAADKWKIAAERVRIVFTEEDGAVRAVRVEIKNCPYAIRAELEKELRAALSPDGGVEIVVLGGR